MFVTSSLVVSALPSQSASQHNSLSGELQNLKDKNSRLAEGKVERLFHRDCCQPAPQPEILICMPTGVSGGS